MPSSRQPASAYPDDDLFQPTLTEEDDAVGIKRPWNPWSLVVLTFFFGLPAGGGLLSWNLYRLGAPRRVLPAVALVVLGTLGLAALDGWMTFRFSDTQRQLGSVLVRAGATLVAAGLAGAQRKRFRVFRSTGQEEGKLLLPGIAAAVLSLIVLQILQFLFLNVFAP
jgi:hypothetical protein